ncbi:MAG: hypothetical protein ABIL62_04925 [Planctomycetota bacterium]
MQEPGIGPKLVLSAACPELAVALSIACLERCRMSRRDGRMGRMDPKQAQMTKILMFSLGDAFR